MSDRPSLEQVQDAVIGAVARVLELDPATLSRTSDLVADLGADSLALVEIVELIEETLATPGFRIADEDIDGLRTIGAAIDYAVARL